MTIKIRDALPVQSIARMIVIHDRLLVRKCGDMMFNQESWYRGGDGGRWTDTWTTAERAVVSPIDASIWSQSLLPLESLSDSPAAPNGCGLMTGLDNPPAF